MNNRIINGATVSDMTLGTVQLGLNYGIANNNGQPKLEQSFEMLKTAFENGVTSIDTARAYGNSENVIGAFLSQNNYHPYITTKVPQITEKDMDVEKTIIEYVETSLNTLGVKKVNNIMLHNAANLTYKDTEIAKIMGDLIKRGYCDSVGVSVYTSEDVQNIFKHEEYTVTQVPMSIFDQRMINDGTVEELKKRKFTVYVRSVFLQGLFFLDPNKINDPILVEYAKPYIEKLRSFAEIENMSVAELAISFMRDVDGISSLVLGSDNSEQVLSNISYFNAKKISDKTFDDIRKTFKSVDIPKIMQVLSRPKK